MALTDENMPRAERHERIVRGLFENRYSVWPASIDEPYAQDVTNESCSICGGFFPRHGELRAFYDERGVWNFVHVGCLVEVGNWVPDNVVSMRQQ
jgi:hypothetical protein